MERMHMLASLAIESLFRILSTSVQLVGGLATFATSFGSGQVMDESLNLVEMEGVIKLLTQALLGSL